MKAIFITQVVIILLVGTGWVMNLVKLVNCDFEPSYKAEAIHALGLIPPVGMITGWLDLGQ